MALPHRPKDVMARYASAEGCLLLEVRRCVRARVRACPRVY